MARKLQIEYSGMIFYITSGVIDGGLRGFLLRTEASRKFADIFRLLTVPLAPRLSMRGSPPALPKRAACVFFRGFSLPCSRFPPRLPPLKALMEFWG
jgi:hypothetical protein